MSLLLDALKKAAEQKAEKESATTDKTVSTTDETIVLEDTQTAIDNTVPFDEDRTKNLEDDTIAAGNVVEQNIETVSIQPEPNSSPASEGNTELVGATESTKF